MADQGNEGWRRDRSGFWNRRNVNSCNTSSGILFRFKQEERFDTVVALAVIEQMMDPGAFLHTLAGFLKESSSAQIIVSTPHPLFVWIHELGAALGIFSKHASEEQEELLDRRKLEAAGSKAGDLRLYALYVGRKPDSYV